MIAAALLCAVLLADGCFYGAKPILAPREAVTTQSCANNDVIVNTGELKHLYGVCTITHYCGCSACCGSWGTNTASGTRPTSGWTVASNCLPFGTKLEINGHIYCVEDRGDDKMDNFWIDIYCDSHQEALDRGMYSTEVYIID